MTTSCQANERVYVMDPFGNRLELMEATALPTRS